jgi:hypothetical protein
MKKMAIFIFGLGIVLFILCQLVSPEENLRNVTLKEICRITGIVLPNDIILEVSKEKDSLNSSSYYLKFKMSTKIWREYTSSDVFLGHYLKPNENILKDSDVDIKGWLPKNVKNSISGIFNIRNGTVFYLFDTNDPDVVVAYFEIGVE